jgi:hypothetical protein
MKTIYYSFLTLLLFSCNSNDDTGDNCIEFHPASIETVVEKPNSDAAYLFDVGFRVSNGCGEFGSFVQTSEGNVITIQVIAEYDGCYCTEDAPLRETIYAFNETIPGIYTLKFKMGEDNYITQTITIE